MNPKTFSVSVNGLTAVCFQRPDLRLPAGVKIDFEEWERENWSKKIYSDKNGAIVPRKMIRAGLMTACRFTELKPPGRLKSFKPIVDTCVLVENDARLEFEAKQLKCWWDYPRRGNGKMAVARPIIETPWAFGVRVSVFDDKLKKAVIEDLFEVFGRACGLGEARGYMGYGRFEATVTEV